MRLVPHRDFLSSHPAMTMVPLTVECRDAAEMTGKMHKIHHWCKSDKSDSLIVWDSSHHKLHLYFEQEKYRTWFALTGI